MNVAVQRKQISVLGSSDGGLLARPVVFRRGSGLFYLVGLSGMWIVTSDYQVWVFLILAIVLTAINLAIAVRLMEFLDNRKNRKTEKGSVRVEE